MGVGSLRRRLITAALVAVGVTIVAVGPAAATFPGTNGEIVSQSFKNRQDLAAVTSTGTRTELAIQGKYPSFSPDGKTLLYACGDDICKANADGTNERILARAPGKTRYRWPGFSRDGKTIVFVAGKGTLSLMRADGKRVREVPKAGNAWQPEFSPKTHRILFSRKVGKDRELFTIGPLGQALTRITNAPKGLDDINPSYSPDGKLIAFERVGSGTTPDEVWTVEADGDDPTKLAGQGSTLLAATPAFSPDGTKIAFSLADTTDELEGYSLWTMNVDGSGQTLLNAEPALQPTWRPLP